VRNHRAITWVVALALLLQAPLMNASVLHSDCCAQKQAAAQPKTTGAHCHSASSTSDHPGTAWKAGTRQQCPLRCCDLSSGAQSAGIASTAGRGYALDEIHAIASLTEFVHVSADIRIHSERGPPRLIVDICRVRSAQTIVS
jgi:hypothetical protein